MEVTRWNGPVPLFSLLQLKQYYLLLAQYWPWWSYDNVLSLYSGPLLASGIWARNLLAHSTAPHPGQRSWAAEEWQGSVQSTHNQPRVNTHNTCTHLCVSNCRFNVPSPAQEHTARDAITASQKKKKQKQNTKSKTFTEIHVCCLQGGLGWS